MVFNTDDHQRNPHQNVNEYYLIPIRMASIKIQKITSVGKAVEKQEPLCTVHWNIKCLQLLWKMVRQFLKKCKLQLPYDAAISHLRACSKELKARPRRDISTPMSTAAQFITRTRKQLKCPLTDVWTSKTQNTQKIDYYSALKKKTFTQATKIVWVNLVDIMLSEISQSQKRQIRCDFTYVWQAVG